MTNPLRNKTVVSCLAIIALLGVAANFLKSPLPVAAAAHDESIALPSSSTEKFDVPPKLAIRDQLFSWASTGRAKTSRDPFAWPQSLAPVSTNAGPAPVFRLQAVSIEGEKTFAVLNQRVVGTGDRLGDYTVERILPGEVWMRGPAGRIIVRLAR